MATLEGFSYIDISYQLSQESRHWNEAECRQRVVFHTNNGTGGGSLLPGAWEVQTIGLPDDRNSYLNTLFEDEYHELALYAFSKHTHFIRWVFRNHMTAAKLRVCLKEIEDFNDERRALFWIGMQQHGNKVATRQRRQHAKEAYTRP